VTSFEVMYPPAEQRGIKRDRDRLITRLLGALNKARGQLVARGSVELKPAALAYHLSDPLHRARGLTRGHERDADPGGRTRCGEIAPRCANSRTPIGPRRIGNGSTRLKEAGDDAVAVEGDPGSACRAFQPRTAGRDKRATADESGSVYVLLAPPPGIITPAAALPGRQHHQAPPQCIVRPPSITQVWPVT
jgi:hypothetical protein